MDNRRSERIAVAQLVVLGVIAAMLGSLVYLFYVVA